MADFTLENYHRKQAHKVTQSIMEQTEKQEQRIQQDGFVKWQQAHQYLVTILRELDQDYDEVCEKNNHPLASHSDEDLFFLIQSRSRFANRNPVEKVSRIEELSQQIIQLQNRCTGLEKDIHDEREKVLVLQKEKEALQAHLSVMKQVQNSLPVQNEETQNEIINKEKEIDIPIWYKHWQDDRLYEKSSRIIQVMGEQGSALRPSIVKEVANQLSLAPGNKNIDEAINQLMSMGESLHLLEQIHLDEEQGSSAGGNQPMVLRLTKAGALAYQLQTGKLPVENEYDLLKKHHASCQHTILNIQVIILLKEEGYQVVRNAQRIDLSNGETYIPDITALTPQQKEIIFIEVERDGNKDRMIRKQKWIKQAEASNGRLFVFCDNLNCQRKIQAEINQALNGLHFESHLTNLHGLRNGKRSEKDGGIWLAQRVS